MKNITITLDTGKHMTKAMMGNKQIHFRTKMEEIESMILDDSSESYFINWKGKDYVLGDGARLEDFDTTKQKLQHKLAAYIASATLLTGFRESEVNLVVLSPLSIFTDRQQRESFRQYILDDGKVEFILEGVKRSLIIKDVTIFAEGCAAAFSNSNLFKDRPVGIVDMGGLNVNGIILNNLSPVQGTDFTINQGGHLLSEKIKKELNKKLGTNIQDYQMDYIIKRGCYQSDKEKSKEIIESVLSDHFKEVLNTMKANNWDTEGLDVFVTGGGSLTVGVDNIKKYIPNAIISDDPIWDNCKGGQIIGAMLYE